MIPLFQAALNSELDYPPNWGPIHLQAIEFADVLDEEFIRCYIQRELEYKTAATDRLYCRHRLLAFVALRKGAQTWVKLALEPPAVVEAQANHIEMIECGAMVEKLWTLGDGNLTCYRCMGVTCRQCHEPLCAESESHTCTNNKAADEHELVKGEDFQVCPSDSCKNPIALWDGCNHVICPIGACGTSFCFICGQQAEEHSDHWKTSCPRYLHPDEKNARFDSESDDSESEEDDDEDHTWLHRPPMTEAERTAIAADERALAEKVASNAHLVLEIPSGMPTLSHFAGLLMLNLRQMHETRHGETHDFAFFRGVSRELQRRDDEMWLIWQALPTNELRRHLPTLHGLYEWCDIELCNFNNEVFALEEGRSEHLEG